MNRVSLKNKISQWAIILFTLVLITGCNDDDDVVPEEENEEEVITDIKLVFTNTENADDVVEASAQDPDGSGVEALVILDEINLDVSKTYTLTFEVMNNLDSPGENIGDEILEENKDHQIFFSFSNDAFTSPTGNGNIDNSSDPLNYNDSDDNGNPVGLSTTWTTSSTQLSSGTFTARLQHQPDIKDDSTGADDGDTDFELQFVLNIQ